MKQQVLFLVAVLGIHCLAAGTSPSPGFELKSESRMITFTENKGQICGLDGLPRPEVRYVAEHGNTQIFLMEKGIAYQFTRMHYPEGYQELLAKHNGSKELEQLESLSQKIRSESYRMDMQLVGADPNVIITTEGKSADYINFFNYNALNVHNYSKIIYHNIYPGINWVIYTYGEKIKYDFVVQPGADPSLIKMEFIHQEELQIEQDGSFTLKNRMGSVTEKSPISFQGTKKINTQFVLNKNILSFVLDNYDSKQVLVIDPALIWATYYGGASYSGASSCYTDASGNIYVSGRASGPSTGLAFGGYQNTFGGGNYDGFLAKFNSGGTPQWTTFIGGSSKDEAFACTVDQSGDIYVVGHTSSNANIAQGGHQSTFGAGGADGFLMKLNSSGSLVWSTYYGGNNFDWASTCATDQSGNIYISGCTSSSNSISFSGHQNTFGGGTIYGDAFLAKFNGSGVLQWATYFGGAGDEYSNSSCFTDASGNVFLGGATTSTSGIASGGYQNTYAGGSLDAYLAKFNSSGTLQWATYYGGSLADSFGNCATDASGNIYAVGYTQSLNNIASGGHQNTFGGGPNDAFLVKLNSAGTLQWATYYGGTDEDDARSCATDQTGNVYITGITSSSTGMSLGGTQNILGGGRDAYFAKFSASGTLQWATYYGGGGDEYPGFCHADNAGNIYLCGETSSSTGIALGGFQNTYGGGNADIFLAKFSNCTPLSQPSVISGNSNICNGTTQTYSIINDPNVTSYTWNLPTGWSGTSTSNTISVVPNSSGTLSVSATSTCGPNASRTISITLDPCTGLATNTTDNSSLMIYPNPCHDRFTLESGLDMEIFIYNTVGQLVLEQKLSAGKNQITINGEENGIYFIVAKQGDLIKTIKIIKD